MKFSIVSAFLAAICVQLVTALPSKATNVSLISREEARGLKVDVMTWTGRIFAYDEHRTSLRGDAKQIWDQIVALNPDYAKENGFEDPRTRDYTQYRPRFDINGVNDMDGTVDCHNATVAERNQMMTDAACNKSHAYLDSLNHGYGTIHIPRLATVSVACIGVCGIKIINKSDREWIGRARDISVDVYRLEDVCNWNAGLFPKDRRVVFHGEVIFSDHSTYCHREQCRMERVASPALVAMKSCFGSHT